MNSNHLIKFKEQLWEFCSQNGIFNDIPESNLEKCKQSFDNIVSNYTNQIIQANDTTMLQSVISNEIKKSMDQYKVMTRDDIKNREQEQFDAKFKQMQDDFNDQHKKNTPSPPPEFKENVSDEPLDKESLENLINEQMKQRETFFNNSMPNVEEKNEIVQQQHHQLPNTNIISPQQYENSSEKIHQKSNIEIKDKIDNLEKKIDIIVSSMNKLINSHIALLKKIK
jgi:hypothetical protein